MTHLQPDQERFLQQAAAQIRRRGWRVPAVAALEAGRPLALVAGQLLWLAQPMLSLLWSSDRIGQTAHLLEDADAVQRLIEYLEGDQAYG